MLSFTQQLRRLVILINKSLFRKELSVLEEAAVIIVLVKPKYQPIRLDTVIKRYHIGWSNTE